MGAVTPSTTRKTQGSGLSPRAVTRLEAAQGASPAPRFDCVLKRLGQRVEDRELKMEAGR
jgi:hypothetical protein